MIGKDGVCTMATMSVSKVANKTAEDWLPIKSIMNGMIQLENGYYVTGVKVAPRNIFILGPEVQNNVIFQLQNFYNTIDYEFWIMVADRPVDINVYLSQLQLLYNRTQSGTIRKLIMQDINKANAFMGTEIGVVDTEYYIIFKEKKMDLIQKRIHNLISGLANCGLNSAQVSNSDLRVLLDNFLNGGRTSNFGTVMPL